MLKLGNNVETLTVGILNILLPYSLISRDIV